MPAFSAEIAQSCAACGIATCTVHMNIRTMQPHPIGREQYIPRLFTLNAGCLGKEIVDSTKPIELQSMNVEAVEKFIKLLFAIGLPRLAQEYILQINAGIHPQDIRLPIDEPFNFPQPVKDAYIATLRTEKTPDASNELGMQSEQRLFAILRNRDLFPWIKEVREAPPKNASYDCTVILEPGHPFTKMLKTDVIYVDAKSSIAGVHGYYSEKTRRQTEGARQRLVREKKLWAINAGPDKSTHEIFAQVITFLLIATNKLNKPALWNSVLDHLSAEARAIFDNEMSVVYNYGRLILMDLVSPQLEAFLRQVAPAAITSAITEEPLPAELPVTVNESLFELVEV